jgi:hypothetical protein
MDPRRRAGIRLFDCRIRRRSADGDEDELTAVRAKLHARDMRLVVDFIPNHTGFDHPWIRSRPERYVHADTAAFRSDPGAFRAVATESGDIMYIACGRDPFFAPWSDVAQLDYSNVETRAAVVAELVRLSRLADGVRCDMAMLVLGEVFARTWNALLGAPMPDVEFWTEARRAAPDLLLLAEVYWDLEWRLQQLGFDFTYDKRLYDRLRSATAAEVRGHLTADVDYRRRSARFVENHDEERSAVAFAGRLPAAAIVMATVPGLRFFHQGQFEGWRTRLPVQLGRWPDETVDPATFRLYDRLLSAANHDVFHDGRWRLLDVHAAGDGTSADLIAWEWESDNELRIVTVNLGAETAHGLVQMASTVPSTATDSIVFEDLLNRQEYSWTRSALSRGLYVKLPGGGAHVFRVAGT